jgi:anaerobic selenocysteine-containing dehydrogenase
MTHVTRREFLRLATIMGGASLFAGCSLLGENAPVPEYIAGAPGADPIETLAGVKTVNTVCGLCPGNCGISCRVAQGTLVKIGGSPYHPISANPPAPFNTPLDKAVLMGGSVCAIGGSGVQTLYDPFRVARPLKRVGPRGSGKWVALTWDQAIKEILEGGDLFGEGTVPGLKSIKDSGSGLSILTGRADWGSSTFLNRFLAAFPGAVWLKDRSTIAEDRAIEAADKVFGPGSGPVAADYRSARTLISFGDAPLDSGVPLVSIAREIADARVDNSGFQWAVVDPRLSTSGSKSDLWVPVIPGKDLQLALGIMRSLTDRYPAIQSPPEPLKKLSSAGSVSAFADACGVPEVVINRLADMLVQGGKRSAAIPGRGIFSGENGTEAGAAVLALNAMVGSVPGSGGLSRRNDPYLDETLRRISGGHEHKADSAGGATKAMILWQTDPVYDDLSVAGGPAPMGGQMMPPPPGLPPVCGPAATDYSQLKEEIVPVPAQLRKVRVVAPYLAGVNAPTRLSNVSDLPLLVAIDHQITETSALADYILPDTTYLERWDVCVPPASVTMPGVGLRCPAVGSMDPTTRQYFPIIAETRIMEDIVIDVAKKLQLPGFGEAVPAGTKPLNTAWDYYRQLFSELLQAMKDSGFPVSPDRDLATVMEQGGLFSADVKILAKKSENTAPGKPRYWPIKAPAQGVVSPTDDGLLLISYALPFHRSPDSGVNSWLLEVLPQNTLLINSVDARKLGLRQGDAIVIDSLDGKVRVQGKAQILGGIRPGVVALARGFGYRQAGAARQVIGNTALSRDKTRSAGVNAAAFASETGPTRVKVKKA